MATGFLGLPTALEPTRDSLRRIAVMCNNLLAGKPGPFRDVVLMNAAAALVISGTVTALADGVTRAAAAIDSGKAKAALAAVVGITNSPAPQPAT